MDYRPSSSLCLSRAGSPRPHTRWLRRGVCALCLVSACSTVKPQDKELLADPAMTYGAGGEAAVQQQHALENREGAAGAGTASGGGCGCN